MFEEIYYDDEFEVAPSKKPGKRKTGTAYRRKMKRKHLEQIRTNTFYGFNRCWRGYTAPYVERVLEGNAWCPSGKYVKYPKKSKRKQFWKRYSNRLMRRNNEVYHGKQYKKACDYHIYIGF